MVNKVHSIEPLQYVLTQIADLTDDEKSTNLLVGAAKGLVTSSVCVCVCVCVCVHACVRRCCMRILLCECTGTSFIVHC